MKRLRPVNSCLPCRKRRVRCDKVHPACSRCTTARIECSYYQEAVSEQSDNLPASSSTEAAALTLSLTGQSSQQIQEPGVSYEPAPEAHSPHAEGAQHRGSRERGQFFPEFGGRSSYIGSTFWANPIQAEYNNFNQSNATIPSQGFGSVSKWANQITGSAYQKSKLSSSQCKFCGDRYKLPCIVAMLPEREICEKLCNVFFATIFPLIPLLHLPTFAEDFDSFWQEIKSTDKHNSHFSIFLRKKPGFVCLLASILFASVVSVPPSRLNSVLGDNTTNLSPGDMHFATTMSAALTGFPRSPSIYSLAAYIFAQSQFMREEDFSDSEEYVSTAFRIALGMGLHRDLAEAGYSVAELEMRRRLWWYILHVDVMASASSGLSPFFIDEKMANAKMISPYYQNQGELSDEQYIDVRFLVASQRYHITKEIRAILRLHFEDALQSVEQVNEAVKNLKTPSSNVSKAIARLIPKELVSFSSSKSVQDQGESYGERRSSTNIPHLSASAHTFARIWKLNPDKNDIDVSIFCSWSAILLHLMVHKAYCILYHPLIRDPALAFNPSIRSGAILHAQSFLYLFYRLCSDPISDPFHWMYPGTYQPLQPLSLLLADLLQYPYSDEADESRGLVDLIFNLYQVDEGIVSPSNPPSRRLSGAGKDAWAILSRTRRKAWGIVGWDSHAFFPSQRVSSDYCVCGERVSKMYQQDDPIISVDDDTNDGLNSYGDDVIPEEHQSHPELMSLPPGTTPGLSEAVGVGDFDWQEWDSTMNMNMGMGIMP
ncbi:fungal-specific transcription factor domain-containing protein [Xylogone sp. PMI_703]|nr:fungal-specific transcription factor domain-containing protein [Xylogone sp. PMI_703]